MIRISITVLKANAEKYVTLAGVQDVFITKNGRVVAKLTSAKPDKVEAAKSLFGLTHGSIDLDAEKENRLLHSST